MFRALDKEGYQHFFLSFSYFSMKHGRDSFSFQRNFLFLARFFEEKTCCGFYLNFSEIYIFSRVGVRVSLGFLQTYLSLRSGPNTSLMKICGSPNESHTTYAFVEYQ